MANILAVKLRKICTQNQNWGFDAAVLCHTAGRFHTNVSQVGEALVHLDPDLVTSVEVGALVPITLQNFIPSCSLHY